MSVNTGIVDTKLYVTIIEPLDITENKFNPTTKPLVMLGVIVGVGVGTNVGQGGHIEFVGKSTQQGKSET